MRKVQRSSICACYQNGWKYTNLLVALLEAGAHQFTYDVVDLIGGESDVEILLLRLSQS
ncbi:hypothetical protein [Paenibacillus taiwanensis]|uniref:hypothetical protein n=1 Tax=Paenibacillus taiwanensis TaxID=401638 RepID=UPI0012F87D53|nr:hypothetical protein [Paenibacillus taiwanensis]